jgi:outer membrane lipoprotein-sorting protein
MSLVRPGALALAALLSLAGCAAPPPPPGPTEPVLLHRSPESLLSPLDSRWQAVRTLRAMARLVVTSPQGRYSTRQTMLWQRPSLLRLDTVAILGQPTMTLVADGQQVVIYYPQQGVFLQGSATATNLQRFIGLPLAAQDVAHLLTGHVPPASRQPGAGIVVQDDRGAYLVRFLDAAGDLRQDVWIEPGQGLPSRVVRYAAQAVPTIDVAYMDFRALTETFSFPFQVVIWLPRAETELRLQFLTVDLNPNLPHSVFEVAPPEGVQVVPLE